MSASSNLQTRDWHLGQLRSHSNHFLPLLFPSQSWGTRHVVGEGISPLVPLLPLFKNLAWVLAGCLSHFGLSTQGRLDQEAK